MQGGVPLEEVYGTRLAEIRPRREEVDALSRAYVDAIAPARREAIARIRRTGVQVVLVSGGLRVARCFGLAFHLGLGPSDVHAVSIHFDALGAYAGYDASSPLTTAKGKSQVVSALRARRADRRRGRRRDRPRDARRRRRVRRLHRVRESTERRRARRRRRVVVRRPRTCRVCPDRTPLTARGAQWNQPATETLAPHRLDGVSFGKIVQIRETLLRAQAKGARVIRFESGDPSFSVAPHVLDADRRGGRGGQDALRSERRHSRAAPRARRKAAHQERHRRHASARRVSSPTARCTRSTSRSARCCRTATRSSSPIRCGPRSPRTFGSPAACRCASPLDAASDYAYDPEAVARAITPATRAIFINTPHNPTGAVLEPRRRSRRSSRSRARTTSGSSRTKRTRTCCTSRTRTARSPSIAGDWADRVISVFSFSKSHAMSGLRVGYIVTQVGGAAGANPEAASLHDQRREQPRAVGRARRGHRAAGSPCRRCAPSIACGATCCSTRSRTFRACARSRRAVRSTSGPSSIRRSTSGSA